MKRPAVSHDGKKRNAGPGCKGSPGSTVSIHETSSDAAASTAEILHVLTAETFGNHP